MTDKATPVTLYEISGARAELKDAIKHTRYDAESHVSAARITLKSEILKLKEKQFYEFMFSDTPDGVRTLYHIEIFARQVAEFAAMLTPRQIKAKNKILKRLKESYLNVCDDYLVRTVDEYILAMRENEKNAE